MVYEQGRVEALAERNALLKERGYTHRICASLYPKEGGDDVILEVLFKAKPTPSQIQSELAKAKNLGDISGHSIEEI